MRTANHWRFTKLSIRRCNTVDDCDELDARSACEIVMLPLFGFFIQQVVLFIQRTCTYIRKMDNGQHSRV